jgi:hypothetical protein
MGRVKNLNSKYVIDPSRAAELDMHASHLTTMPMNRIADLRHPNDALHPIITLIHRGQNT